MEVGATDMEADHSHVTTVTNALLDTDRQSTTIYCGSVEVKSAGSQY